MSYLDDLMDEIELKIHEKGIYTVTKKTDNNGSFIFKGVRKQDGKKIVMKFPFEKSIKEIDNTYNIKRELDDLEHIVKIIGEGPLNYAGEPAILMEEGVPLKDVLLMKKKNKEVSFFDPIKMTYQVSKGLHELHKKGIKHRDIKPSNLIYYEDSGWTISDFGSSRKGDYSNSAGTIKEFLAYEIANIPQTEVEINIDPRTDIFAIGACLFNSIQKENKTLYHLFEESQRKDKTIRYDYVFAEQEINKLDTDDKTKYFLKRLLGDKHPGKLIEGKTSKDYRYENIDFFLEEYDNGVKTAFEEHVDTNPTYKNFLDTLYQFDASLDKLNTYRKGDWNLISLEKVDEMESLRIKLEHLVNDPLVKSAPEINKEFGDVTDKHRSLGEKEFDILYDKIGELKPNFKDFSDEEYIKKFGMPFAEYIFLWGPPLIRENVDRKKGEKVRYSLAEIKAKKTHFHNPDYFKKK